MHEAADLTSRTNHSLQVTGATTLFSKNVPKKLVQEVTGQCSLECLRRYEKTIVKEQCRTLSNAAYYHQSRSDHKLFANCTASPQWNSNSDTKLWNHTISYHHNSSCDSNYLRIGQNLSIKADSESCYALPLTYYTIECMYFTIVFA